MWKMWKILYAFWPEFPCCIISHTRTRLDSFLSRRTRKQQGVKEAILYQKQTAFYHQLKLLVAREFVTPQRPYIKNITANVNTDGLFWKGKNTFLQQQASGSILIVICFFLFSCLFERWWLFLPFLYDKMTARNAFCICHLFRVARLLLGFAKFKSYSFTLTRMATWSCSIGWDDIYIFTHSFNSLNK